MGQCIIREIPTGRGNIYGFGRCEILLENINVYQALAFGLWATGRRFFYILWKFYRVDFQNQLFVSKQVELHSSFEN